MTAPAPAPASAAWPHPPRCPCASCAVEDVLILLKTGRVAMALARLEPLPGQVRDALAAAYRQGQEHGLAAAAWAVPGRGPIPGKPRPPRRHELLAAALADGRVTIEQVAAVLRVEPRHVATLVSGQVGLAASTWKRLRKELGW